MFSVPNRAKTLGVLLSAGIALPLALVAPASAESIAQAARHAVATHPDVAALEANRVAIGEELRAAQGLALPGVRLEGRYGYYDDYGVGRDHGDVAVRLRQPVYDGGRARSETRRQRSRVASADSRVGDTVETIALQAVQAYFEVVRARRVLDKSRKNLHAVGRIVKRVEARVAGGAGTRADAEQARTRLVAAKRSVASAEVQLDDAVALYVTAVGKHPGNLEQADLPTRHLPRSLDQVLEAARGASPKLAAIRHDAAAAAFAVGTARSVIRPKLDLELSAGYSNRLANVDHSRPELGVGLRFKMNLYNGGIDRARIREAIARAEEAERIIDSAGLSVERELRVAWNAYKGSGRKVALSLEAARSNERLVKLRLAQYEGGQASLISILDAQNEAYVAGVEATNEYNAGRFAFYKLLAASGSLAKVLGATREGA